MHPARLHIAQQPRNPSERERQILALLTQGETRKQAAGHLHLKPRSITAAMDTMRQRYAAPTQFALIALAIRLSWIPIEIDCHAAACSGSPSQSIAPTPRTPRPTGGFE